MNASPGPLVATVATGLFVLLAINPMTENTTKPAVILVAEFASGTMSESLEIEINSFTRCLYKYLD